MKFNIFVLRIFSFKLYIYYLTRGFIASTHACRFELVSRGFELVIGEFELITCELELVTRGFELVTRFLLFHTKIEEKAKNFE